ncbi:MAG: hypothetical protein ACYDCQ_13760 [Dehalococcoidia bacterium]
MHRFALLMAGLALMLTGLAAAVHPAVAQEISGADLAVGTLSADDLPGFTLAGEAAPDPVAGATREQFTRTLSMLSPADGKLVVLTIVLSAPLSTNPCLPLIPAAIAGGHVFSDLNDTNPNFALFGSVGAGDADSTATWAELDTGINQWTSLYAGAFIRGQLSVYVFYRTYGALPPFAQFADLMLAQDDKLKQAAIAAPTSPLALMLTTPVPPPDTAAAECYG